MERPIEDRFWEKVNIRSPADCWEWQAGTIKGYGEFWVKPKMEYAHRISWLLSFGPIPDGLAVLHKCDNPLCVNPNHLFLGTQLDNIQDRVSKHRSKGLKGELHSQHKLTDKDVIEIRQLYLEGNIYQRDLAKQFGVSQTTIWYIVSGQYWKHLMGSGE